MPKYTVIVAAPAPTAQVTVWVDDDTTDPEEIDWEINDHLQELDAAGRIEWEPPDDIEMDVIDYWLDED